MDMLLSYNNKTVKMQTSFRTPLKIGRFLSKQGEVLNFGDLNPFIAST